MKIWIHKHDDYLREYLQPDTDIHYIEEEHISDDDVVLLRSSDILCSILKGPKVVFYNKDLETIKTLALNKLCENYDYYELSYQLQRNDRFDTLVVGSSYALFGLDMKLLPTGRNMALGSQDIYYSSLLARKLYEKSNYKRLIWGGHYYTFYSDLSRTQNPSELLNITNIYSRIFPHSLGLHNALFVPNRVEEKSFSAIYDLDKMVNKFIKEYFEEHGGNYWSRQRTRFSCRQKLWSGEKATWSEITQDEKIKAAKQRAELHNKSIRYVQSLKENINIFTDMGLWCLENNIEFYIVNFPVSKYYHEAENSVFKETFYDVIKNFSFPAVLLDFEEIEFGDECFNDPDHLNDIGATKLTEILVRNI